MSVSTDNKISVKEFNKISTCKDLEIEMEKNVTPKNYHRTSNSRSTGYDQERDRYIY